MSVACSLCENKPISLWEDQICYVSFVDDKNYPGFCRVISNTHVKEMTDLTESQSIRIMKVVLAVESFIRKRLNPEKINLASLGNITPHVHWHVIPRWNIDTRFPDSPWSPSLRPFQELPKPGDSFEQELGEYLNNKIEPSLFKKYN